MQNVIPSFFFFFFNVRHRTTRHHHTALNGCFCFFLSVFLAEQFESLQSHLDTMMPAAKKPFLQQFYSQVYMHLLSKVYAVTGTDNRVVAASSRPDI